MALNVLVVGEGMIELSKAAPHGLWRMGSGGDTLNTAIHLARLGCEVAFASALGGDAFSMEVRESWGREGLDLDTLLTDLQRMTGLYAIHTDEGGNEASLTGDGRARLAISLLTRTSKGSKQPQNMPTFSFSR